MSLRINRIDLGEFCVPEIALRRSSAVHVHWPPGSTLHYGTFLCAIAHMYACTTSGVAPRPAFADFDSAHLGVSRCTYRWGSIRRIVRILYALDRSTIDKCLDEEGINGNDRWSYRSENPRRRILLRCACEVSPFVVTSCVGLDSTGRSAIAAHVQKWTALGHSFLVSETNPISPALCQCAQQCVEVQRVGACP